MARPHILHGMFWLVIGAMLSGCSQEVELANVSGKVTQAGRPLSGVQVVFLPDPAMHPGLPRSTGITNDRGQYQLTCDDGRLGAVIGTHLVMIVDLAMDRSVMVRGSEAEDAPARRSQPRVPAAYQSSKSPLRQTVAPGEQTIELKVESP